MPEADKESRQTVPLLVSSACSGSGFPVEWTTATSGVTYWFVTEAIKRQFSSGYAMTDYQVSDSQVYGTAPTCEDEYYNSSTGYYYYLMYFPAPNIYSTEKKRQICHGFKQFDNVIREYYEDLLARNVLSSATDCVARFTSSTRSLALTKYNFQYVNCPFSNVNYNFTFSNGGNADYCSGQTSTVVIGNEVISLNSCFDSNSVSKANPFYGAFSCLAYWSPETRDTTTSGDFIVLEMYDTVAWPYCGVNIDGIKRYKVAADGTITLSLYLSMSEDAWVPAYCDASKDNEYYFESGTTKYVRMVFTPVDPVTQATDTTTETETSTESTTPTTDQTTTTTTTTTTDQTTTTTTTTTESTTDTTTTAQQTTTESTTTDTVTFTTVTTTTGNSTSTSSSTSFWNYIRDLYWPWWILVAAVIVLIAALLFCIIYACLKKMRKQNKVENQKLHEQANTKQAYNTKAMDHSNTKDKNIGHVRKIQVQSISPTKVKDINSKTSNALDF